jgi:hypothetical protein
MGFLSTFITQQINGFVLPDWFKSKWEEKCLFLGGTLVASKQATKILYANDFFEDYRWALIELGYFNTIPTMDITVLAENGFVTKVQIELNRIRFNLLEEGHDLDSVWSQ